MFALKRNQVIVTALVAMIVIAGYLNYTDSKKAQTAVNNPADGAYSGLQTVYDDMTGQEVSVVNNGITGIADENEIGIAVDYDESSDTYYGDGSISLVEDEETNSDYDLGAAVFVNNSNDSSYFIQAKLDREQARSKRKEMLTELINNNNIESDKKAECVDEILEIQARIEKETTAEAMIEAKGFTEAYVRIDADTVDVVVSKAALTDAEIAQITDIVTRKTGYETSQIRISTQKSS